MAAGRIPKFADGTDSTWTEITHANISGSINVRKIGNIVTVVASGITLKTALTATNVIIGSLASGYRPIVNANFPGGNSAKFGQVRILSTGNILFYKPSGDTWATTDVIHFCMTYITA